MRNMLRGLAAFALLTGAAFQASASQFYDVPTDDIASAPTVPMAGGVASFDVNIAEQATASSSDPSCGLVSSRTLWYRYTTTVDTWVLTDFENYGADRARTAVWQGGPGALTAVQCDPNASQVEFEAKPGTTYYIELASPTAAVPNYGGSIGFELTPQTSAPAPNDLLGQALPIAAIPYTASLDLGDTPANFAEPVACAEDTYELGNPPARSAWYRYKAISSAALDVLFTDPALAYFASDTAPIPYVAVFTSSDGSGSPESLQRVICSWVGPFYYLSGLRFTPVAGTTYWLEYGGEAAPPYTTPIALRAAPAPTAGTVTVNPTVDLKITKTRVEGTVFIYTYATVHLDYTCPSSLPTVALSVLLKQGTASGFLWNTGTCSGGRGSADLQFLVSNSFVAGAGTVSATLGEYTTNMTASSPNVAVTLASSSRGRR